MAKQKKRATKKSSAKRSAKAKKGGKKSPAKKPAKKPAKGGAKGGKKPKPVKKTPAKKPVKKAPRPQPRKPPTPAIEVPEPAPVTYEVPELEDAGDTSPAPEVGDPAAVSDSDGGDGGDAGDEDDYTASGTRSFEDLVGKAMIINILGDAEAYFFDFTKLGPERRRELIAHHLAAFDQRKQGEGISNWHDDFVPIALLGESMPPAIRTQFDLSAPHEGVLLHHAGTGALLYAASKNDDKLAIFAPDLDTISPRESFVSDVFDPDEQSYAFEVDRSQSEGFTLGELETLMQTAGAELTLV